MEKQQKTTLTNTGRTTKSKGLNPFITILILFIISELIFHYVFGSTSNFIVNEMVSLEERRPKEGNVMGIIYKGGIIIPFLMTFVFMVIVFSIERFFIITKAEGTSSLDKFVNDIRDLLNKNEVDKAIALCDVQKGSIGNVVREGLLSYKSLSVDTTLNKEQKLTSLSNTLEEATTLEMPTLEKNMTILATVASVGTLIALMGTVIGMIKAFFALGKAGVPDAAALSVGISEALVNTALGIGASALAIIAYNFFTSKIDTLTFKIDEIGLSIQQSFATHH